MGLSILIPVYNYLVSDLVKSLAAQLQQTGAEGEIILLDDGSTEEIIRQNEKLIAIPGVLLEKNAVNLGRMLTRQKLSEFATHNYLLFLDADSELPDPNFLSKYLAVAAKQIPVASGGRIYGKLPACQFRLHWKYGTERESRIKNKGAGFMTNNFLVKKEIFEKLDHSIELSRYGHEDSWLGIQFDLMGIKPHYFNNPVLHGQLELSSIFLEKSLTAIENILILENKTSPGLLGKHVKIYRIYRKLRRWRLTDSFLLFEKRFHKRFYQNLLSCEPKLINFDYYRLAELIRLKRKIN